MDSQGGGQTTLKYRRVLLKLSGQAFGHPGTPAVAGINIDATVRLAQSLTTPDARSAA